MTEWTRFAVIITHSLRFPLSVHVDSVSLFFRPVYWIQSDRYNWRTKDRHAVSLTDFAYAVAWLRQTRNFVRECFRQRHKTGFMAQRLKVEAACHNICPENLVICLPGWHTTSCLELGWICNYLKYQLRFSLEARTCDYPKSKRGKVR